MQTIFKKFGFGLTVAKGRRVLHKVCIIVPCVILLYFSNLFFPYFYTFPYLLQPGSVPTPSPTTASSRHGGGPSLVVESSTTPSTQAASPHEVRTTDIISGAPEV
jgi:hypothetical protein